MNKFRLRVAAAIILNSNNQILIAQRPPWEFPGGKLEPFETPEMAVRREIREELGLVLRVADELCSFSFLQPEKVIEFTFFLCQLESEPATLTSTEHERVCWVSPEKIFGYEFLAADQLILHFLQRKLTKRPW